jgi:hypothetical protein
MMALAGTLSALLLTFADDPAPEVASPKARQSKEGDIAEARRRFQTGTELYEENNPTGALAEFRRAYQVAPHFRILFNIGQLCFLVQDYACAHDSLTRYLSEGGQEIPPARRDQVRRDLARLESRVARVRIVADKPGAEVFIDKVAVGKTPLQRPVLVSVGRPEIRLSLAGHVPATRVVELAAMDNVSVQFELQPVTAPAPADLIGPSERARLILSSPVPSLATAAPTSLSAPAVDSAASPRSSPTMWIATGVLGAAAGAGAALAHWSSSDLRAGRTRLASAREELLSRSSRTRRLALATDILLGATVLSAGIATYLTFRTPADLALTPSGLSLAGRF